MCVCVCLYVITSTILHTLTLSFFTHPHTITLSTPSQDQCLTRSDMWRVTSSLVREPHARTVHISTHHTSPLHTHKHMHTHTTTQTDSFVHVSKKLEHAGVRVTVSRLWSSSGEVVSSGAVLSRTRVCRRDHRVNAVLITIVLWQLQL